LLPESERAMRKNVCADHNGVSQTRVTSPTPATFVQNTIGDRPHHNPQLHFNDELASNRSDVLEPQRTDAKTAPQSPVSVRVCW